MRFLLNKKKNERMKKKNERMKKEKMKRLWFFFPLILVFNVSLYKKREEELGQMTKKSLISPLVTFWYYPSVSVLVKLF
jgi:hypothetical protein